MCQQIMEEPGSPTVKAEVVQVQTNELVGFKIIKSHNEEY